MEIPPGLLFILMIATATAGTDTPFGDLDRDRDGRLSAREVAALRLDFAALDTDRNGYLSRSEIRAREVRTGTGEQGNR